MAENDNLKGHLGQHINPAHYPSHSVYIRICIDLYNWYFNFKSLICILAVTMKNAQKNMKPS